MRRLAVCLLIALAYVTGCGVSGQNQQGDAAQSNQFVVLKDLGYLSDNTSSVDGMTTTQDAEIIEDTKTGIEYLWVHETTFGGAGGLTPYLNPQGKPISSR